MLDILSVNKEYVNTYYNHIFLQSANKSLCSVYDIEAKMNRFFIPSIWKHQLRFKSDDISLTTQLTPNSLTELSKLLIIGQDQYHLQYT